MISFSLTARILLTVCFIALLTVVSLMPGDPKPGDFAFMWLVVKTPTLIQKVLHVCLYGVLTLLLVWSLENIESRPYRLLIAFLIAVAIGAVMEWCQTKVPGRFGTAYDVALNAVGAVVGLFTAVVLL
ncbi:MAG: VanZ family protein [Nitrospirota bacterium]